MIHTAKITVKFPFPIQQTESNSFEIALGGSVPFPFLEPDGDVAEKFDRTFGVPLQEHEKIVETLNEEYRRRLILATARVS